MTARTSRKSLRSPRRSMRGDLSYNGGRHSAGRRIRVVLRLNGGNSLRSRRPGTSGRRRPELQKQSVSGDGAVVEAEAEVDRDFVLQRPGYAVQNGGLVLPLPDGVERGLIQERRT